MFYDDRFLPSLRTLAEAMHSGGAAEITEIISAFGATTRRAVDAVREVR